MDNKTQSRWKDPPYRYGPHVTYDNFFSSFLMFSTAPIRQNYGYATESCL